MLVEFCNKGDMDNEIEDVDQDRAMVHRKRLTEGFFVYSLLEIKQRYHIEGTFCCVFENFTFFRKGHLVPDIDESLAMYQDQIKSVFSRRWAKHKCSKPGW